MIRRIATGVIASAASLLLAALALEAGLRVLGIGEDARAHPHPWAGWTLIPDRRVEIASEDPAYEGRIVLQTNSLGLSDVQRSASKPPGTYRILVLGDSFVQGAAVPLDSTVSRQLERALNGRGGPRVEAWNCSAVGWATSNELLYLRHVARPYDADLVVLCFLAANDVEDQSTLLCATRRNRPFFRVAGDSLELDRSHYRADVPPIAWLRMNSRLFNYLSYRRRVMLAESRRRAQSEWRGPGLPPALQLYASRPDSVWAQAWDVALRLILETRDEARRQGADFLLVSISVGAQEHLTARAAYPEWMRWKDHPGWSLDMPEQRLARLSVAHGIDYLPLLPEFRALQESSGVPLHIGWNGHWNSAGHAAAARIVAARIAPRLERPSR